MPFEGSFEDRLALRDLLDAYADAVNRADSEAWAATWDEGGRWSLPGFGIFEGKAKIVDIWRAAMRGFPISSFAPGRVRSRSVAKMRPCAPTPRKSSCDGALHRTLDLTTSVAGSIVGGCSPSDGFGRFRSFQEVRCSHEILIQAVIDIDPGTRGDALVGARGGISGALAQPGCLAYAWTLDPHVATRIHVFEEWDGEAALAAHLGGPQYRRMLGIWAHLAFARHRGANSRCRAKGPSITATAWQVALSTSTLALVH